jgi:hypothetical protein
LNIFNLQKKQAIKYYRCVLKKAQKNGRLHLIAGIKKKMKNRPMTMRDKILLRKRSVTEIIYDELKNICEMEHSRHRRAVSFLINLLHDIPLRQCRRYLFAASKKWNMGKIVR